MNTNNNVDKIHSTLSKVYNIDYELELYTSLVSEFYNLGTDDLEVERIVTGLYNKTSEHTVKLGEIIKLIEDMYLHKINPNSGVDGIKQIVTKQYDKNIAVEVVEELKTILTPYNTHQNFQIPIKDNTYVVMNFEQKEVAVRTVKFNAK